MINVVKRPTILFYKNKYPKAAVALDLWYQEYSKRSFKTPQEVKEKYGSASVIANGRLVFNIMGNKYRLVVRMKYHMNLCLVLWFGTHKEYDCIDVKTVKFETNE